MLDTVRKMAGEFDVLHFHIDLMQYPLAPFFGAPFLTTLHGRLDLPDLQPFYRRFDDVPLVSISDAQRAPMPPVRWLRTIHHGIPPHLSRSARAAAATSRSLGGSRRRSVLTVPSGSRSRRGCRSRSRPRSTRWTATTGRSR
jgi:hypothetical protein